MVRQSWVELASFHSNRHHCPRPVTALCRLTTSRTNPHQRKEDVCHYSIIRTSLKIPCTNMYSYNNKSLDFNCQKMSKQIVLPSSEESNPSFKLYAGDRIKIKMIRGNDLMPADVNGLSDPYVVLDPKNPKDLKLNRFYHHFQSQEKCHPGGSINGFLRTTTQLKTLNPIWNDEFDFELLKEVSELTINFQVYDWDRLTKDDRRFQFHLVLTIF